MQLCVPPQPLGRSAEHIRAYSSCRPPARAYADRLRLWIRLIDSGCCILCSSGALLLHLSQGALIVSDIGCPLRSDIVLDLFSRLRLTRRPWCPPNPRWFYITLSRLSLASTCLSPTYPSFHTTDPRRSVCTLVAADLASLESLCFSSMSSSSLLFSTLTPASPSTSSFTSSSRSRPEYRRSSTFSGASIYSRDSWCSNAESDISVSSTTQGHISHEQKAFEQVVLASIATNAIFGSTSPRKNRSAGMRTSIDSARSWTSSGSSVRSPLTPEAPLSALREDEVTKTPMLATIALPPVDEIPKRRRPQLSRIVSDEVQYIGRSLDVPVSEDGHAERSVCIQRSASTTSSASRNSKRYSRFSQAGGKDDLKLAMDELEQELARTMATLSASNSPASTVSVRSRSKAQRRPHTADKVMAVGSAKAYPTGLAQVAVGSSASMPSRSRFQRESWMSSSSIAHEGEAIFFTKPIRFSASDLTLLAEGAETSRRSSVMSIQDERPISTASSYSSLASRSALDDAGVPALVFDGRHSGSSTGSSVGSFQDASSRPGSLVAVPPVRTSSKRRPGTARAETAAGGIPRAGLYQLGKASRSTPSLVSRPPHEPLPPLPSLPAGLSQLLASAPAPPPRPTKSLARTPTSSHRNSPVPWTDKALPRIPC